MLNEELRKPLLIGLLCFIALLFVIKYGLSPSLFISFLASLLVAGGRGQKRFPQLLVQH